MNEQLPQYDTIPMVWSDKDRGEHFVRLFQNMLENVVNITEDNNTVIVGAVVESLPEHNAHVVKFLTKPR